VRRTPALAPALAAAVALASTSGCELVSSWSDAPAPIVRGPIPARTQEPVKLTFLAFRPRRAAIQPEGSTLLSVQSAYSSIYQNGHTGNEDVVFDAEIWHTSLALRRAVAPSTDLEVELAVTYATSGFLDLIVEEYHHILGFPSEGRTDRPRFAYEMDAFHNGNLAYRLDGNEVGFGDLPIVLTHSLVDESASHPGVSIRAGVELPTGSEEKGFGNGQLDYGGGLLAEKAFGRWNATAAVDYVVAGTSRTFERADVSSHDNLDLQAGIEYRWNDRLSFLLGSVLESPVTRDIGLKEIDGNILSIDVGAAWDLGNRSRLLLDFGEDAISRAGPDFTLMAAWSISL
jgi:hypothetical protein